MYILFDLVVILFAFMKNIVLKSLVGLISIFALTFLLYNCGNKQNKINIVHSKKENIVKGLTIDTIKIIPKALSGEGYFVLEENNILYFDEVFATVSIFDLNGNYISTKLGLGQGPNEVNGLQQYLRFNDKRLVFKGFNVYSFDKNWNKTDFFRINWGDHHSLNELSRNPNPEYQDLYEVKYFENKYEKIDDKHIIFNIETSHPNYNFCTTKEYYSTSRIFAKLNIETHKVDGVFGRKSDKYLNYNLLPIYDYHYYDIANDIMYINFEPDYLIYTYDRNHKPLKAFGVPGKIINDRYLQTFNFKDYENNFYTDRSWKGYYCHLKYIGETNYLFRNYHIGRKEIGDEDAPNPLGLQIYYNENLIGDLKIPPKFKIIGYRKPWYYADGYVNETGENIVVGFYRFKLNFENAL